MINNAIGFAVKAHQGQVRKGTDMPYIKHPMHVGLLLTQLGAEDDVIIAGILHDVLEDTAVTPEEIRVEFGERVLALINGASEPDKSLSWRERKEHTIHYLKTAPRDVQLISLCDKYSNLSDMAKDLMKEGPGFWQRFNAGVEEQKWYYESLVLSLRALKDVPLYYRFAELVTTVFGVNQSVAEATSISTLWNQGSEEDWIAALKHYWEIIKPANAVIEAEFEKLDHRQMLEMPVEEFYYFLHNGYFVWKYTAKNRLATTRENLSRYYSENRMDDLAKIQKALFAFDRKDIKQGLEIANSIHGLGTAGASGLLSILYPMSFGTVDQFVVKSLLSVHNLPERKSLEKMKPEMLKIQDGVALIQILRNKAAELNERFGTNYWTPRKMDQILWSIGR